MDMTPRIKNMTTRCSGNDVTRGPTVAASFVRGLIDFAASRGAGRQELVERSRIAPEELRDRDNRVAFEKYVTLMRAAKELCHDPAFALHFGEGIDASEISIMPMTGGPSGTMAETIAELNRYGRLDIDLPGDRIQLCRIDGRLWMVDVRANPNDFLELTESAFARMVCTMRRWLPGAQLVEAIHVTHGEPPYRAEYDRIFRMPVVFGSDRNALLFSDGALPEFRTPFSSPYASGILRAHADALLERLESAKTTRGRVESLLLSVLHTGDASMDTTAGKLGVSRQTLFRKLKAEGVTFGKVLDELRRRMALHYLNGEKVSVKETAYRVGFSDPAAFSRAFKRWTGSSPGASRPPKPGKSQPRASE
jgi:AraC-like DNA-binding protein